MSEAKGAAVQPGTRIGYLDAGGGMAGDMFLGAAIDAGFPLEQLEEVVRALGLGEVRLRAQRVLRQGVSAVHVAVEAGEEHHARHLPDILRLLEGSGLPEEVVTGAGAAFTRLAEVEARIHGCLPEQVHFHEVGAKDALVDIVGAFLAKRFLGLEALFGSPAPLGSGQVRCAHGLIPVPAPATLALLHGWPVIPGGQPGEMVTPTGALILRQLTGEWRPCPSFQLEKTGYGAGTRDDPGRANVFRLMIGTVTGPAGGSNPGGEALGDVTGRVPLLEGVADEEVVVLEANLDDFSPEWCGHLIERLLVAGALDAFASQIQMKKGRPSLLVSALAAPERAAQVADAFLRESTSLGIRYRRQRRLCLSRDWVQVEVGGAAVRVKAGFRGEERLNLAPEYEDCRKAALATGLPLKEVYALAQAKARQALGEI
ncbi:MAG: nickel pincer cofactor biosynthesis protein LarC [Chitinophagales bacterium]